MGVVTAVLDLVALALLVPTTVLLVECAAACLPARRRAAAPAGRRPRTAVIVPAHNEAAGIGACVEQLRRQLRPEDRLLVVADNCDDDTAVRARVAGAVVVERRDVHRWGKGYALDYALRVLEDDPPEVVVMVDADCVAADGTIDTIACEAAVAGRPVQATYLSEPSGDATFTDRVSALAVVVKNLVRPRGLARLGLPCLLTGAGMAFPWSVLRVVSVAGGETAEDMRLAVRLAVAGYPPTHSPAIITTVQPGEWHAARLQRTRWEHGHLETLRVVGPQVVAAIMRQRRIGLLAVALELSVPPLSLLVMLWVGAAAVALLAGGMGASWTPAALLASSGLLLLGAVGMAWVAFGRRTLPPRELRAIPLYVLRKIPMYLAFVTRRQSTWIRSRKGGDRR